MPIWGSAATLRDTINPEELAMCKRRDHDIPMLGTAWKQCGWCGAWVREVHTIEGREDDPPEDEPDGQEEAGIVTCPKCRVQTKQLKGIPGCRLRIHN